MEVPRRFYLVAGLAIYRLSSWVWNSTFLGRGCKGYLRKTLTGSSRGHSLTGVRPSTPSFCGTNCRTLHSRSSFSLPRFTPLPSSPLHSFTSYRLDGRRDGCGVWGGVVCVVHTVISSELVWCVLALRVGVRSGSNKIRSVRVDWFRAVLPCIHSLHAYRSGRFASEPEKSGRRERRMRNIEFRSEKCRGVIGSTNQFFVDIELLGIGFLVLNAFLSALHCKSHQFQG